MQSNEAITQGYRDFHDNEKKKAGWGGGGTSEKLKEIVSITSFDRSQSIYIQCIKKKEKS